MHIHILGIGGTFMGGLACLAKERGYRVTGQDSHIYPPMSTQLESLGIALHEGYDDAPITQMAPDCVIVGNALSRGVPVIETLLNRHLFYQSGPQWLKENILKDRWVIGVAGTHGKTTTASMVAWIIEYAGFNPGFLIGGVPSNFGISARLGENPYFVIEADEYDTAFFDKRSKFLHYSPQTCILNNLEYDHADIFEDMNAIYKQFHHFVRTIPSQGLIIRPQEDMHLDHVLNMNCWTPIQTIGLDWQFKNIQSDSSAFEVYYQNKKIGEIYWDLIGNHNAFNALASIAAAHHAGIQTSIAIKALSKFKSVKRRMEIIGQVNNITVYDDFAHHPTAIQTTLEGLHQKIKNQNQNQKENRIVAVLDLRSNTMKKGTHKDSLGSALKLADKVVILKTNEILWDIQELITELGSHKLFVLDNPTAIVNYLVQEARPYDHILIMSNGGFSGIHQIVLKELSELSTV